MAKKVKESENDREFLCRWSDKLGDLALDMDKLRGPVDVAYGFACCTDRGDIEASSVKGLLMLLSENLGTIQEVLQTATRELSDRMEIEAKETTKRKPAQ